MPLPGDQGQVASRRLAAGIGKWERVGKARQTPPSALLGGLAHDPFPAGPLALPTPGGSGHGALGLDGHKSAHAQLGSLLQDPLKALALEHALVESQGHARLTGDLPSHTHTRRRAAARQVDQLDLVLPTPVVQRDDPRARAQA